MAPAPKLRPEGFSEREISSEITFLPLEQSLNCIGLLPWKDSLILDELVF